MLVVSTPQAVGGAQRAPVVGASGPRRTAGVEIARKANRSRAVRTASYRPLQGVFFGTPGATAPREATKWHRNPVRRGQHPTGVGRGGRVRCLRRRAGPSVTTVENLAARRGVEGVVNATAVATTVATPRGGAPREKPGGYGWAWRTRRGRARRPAVGGVRGVALAAADEARPRMGSTWNPCARSARARRLARRPPRGNADAEPIRPAVNPTKASPGGLSLFTPELQRSHARPNSCRPGGCKGEAGSRPWRGRLRRPLSARLAGSADMSRSGREPAEGLLRGVPETGVCSWVVRIGRLVGGLWRASGRR